MPSAAASNVASSTRVDMAEVTAFHSSGDFVRATNTKLSYLGAPTDFKHCYLGQIPKSTQNEISKIVFDRIN